LEGKIKKKVTLLTFVLVLFVIAVGDFNEDYPDLEYATFKRDGDMEYRFYRQFNFRQFYKNTIKYEIKNFDEQEIGITKTNFKSEIEAAFNSWFSALSSFKGNPFTLEWQGYTDSDRDSTDGICTFLFEQLSDDGGKTDNNVCYFSENDPYVKDSDISLNENNTWSLTKQDYQNDIFDVRTILTHEIGHLFGFGHNSRTIPPSYDEPTMSGHVAKCFDGNLDQGEPLEGRSLENCDKSAIKWMYGDTLKVPKIFSLEHALDFAMSGHKIKVKEGTYNITKDVTLISGVKLIIDPGVTVKFKQDNELSVYGQLIAEGTSNNRISFEKSEANNWEGITVYNNANTSVFKYCDFSGADYALTLNNNDATVQNCSFENNNYGIKACNFSNYANKPYIYKCNFDNNIVGVVMTSYTSGKIEHCKITNSSGSYGILGSTSSCPRIIDNRIEDNDAGCDGIYIANNSSSKIHQNTIKGNDNGIMAFIGGVNTYDDPASENLITLNDDCGIYAYDFTVYFGYPDNNGNNTICDNDDYEAKQTPEDETLTLQANGNYWSGQQSDVYGNIGIGPVLPDSPSCGATWSESDPSAKITFNNNFQIVNVMNKVNKINKDGTKDINKLFDIGLEKGLEENDWTMLLDIVVKMNQKVLLRDYKDINFENMKKIYQHQGIPKQILLKIDFIFANKDFLEGNFFSCIDSYKDMITKYPDKKNIFLEHIISTYLYNLKDIEKAEEFITVYQNFDGNNAKLKNTMIELFEKSKNTVLNEIESKDNFNVKRLPEVKTNEVKLFKEADIKNCKNYPNPFNNETLISFSLKKGTNVSVSIYNLLGQKIKNLSSGYLKKGIHRIRWDGRNDTGVSCSSGIFICRIKTANFRKSFKLILMK